MVFLAFQIDVQERIEALSGDNTQLVGLIDILVWSAVGLTVLGVVYFLCRLFLRESGLGGVKNDRRGYWAEREQKRRQDETKFMEGPELASDVSHVDHDDDAEFVSLSALEPETRVSLFWDMGGLRCGCLGQTAEASGEGLLVSFDTDSAPRKDRALLACPESDGHVSFYDVMIEEAPDSRSRILQSASLRSVSRVNRRYRTHTSLPAAVLLKDAPEDAEPMMMVRVHDMAFDGLGVLSEEALRDDDELLLRIELPGYLEPLTMEGSVAWSQKDLAGIHRAGLMLNLESIETRLILADYMFGRLKAESSAIIMEKRQSSHTPIKPTEIPTP